MRDESICKTCLNVSNCKYFIEILRLDEQTNKKYDELNVFTVIYQCKSYKSKYSNALKVDENGDSGGWVGYHKWS
jgi:hypothetical protein